MKDGIALTNIPHPEGDPVTDDHEFNPDSLETIEVDIPVMPEDQLETWMYNMIRACNRSTSDSDINVIKLIQHIENLYMQGRADERKKFADKYLEANYKYASLLQAVTDPENQPSQFGTVTDKYLEQAILKEREACVAECWVQMGLIPSQPWTVNPYEQCAKAIKARGKE